MGSPISHIALLIAFCFTLATQIHLWFQGWSGNRLESADLMQVLLGNSRQMLARHFYVKADVYFHSGYYPTMFDQVDRSEGLHIAEHVASDHSSADPHAKDDAHKDEHDDLPDFLQKPTNWIEKFGRNFYPTAHEHLEKPAQTREMLPWLLLASRMNPREAQTYVVTAYWLRSSMGKIDEAENFLREGLGANPGHPEILFELGRIQLESRKDSVRARNLWEVSLKNIQIFEEKKISMDETLKLRVLAHLARLEEDVGDIKQAVAYLKQAVPLSAKPENLLKQIQELEARLKK